jgi:hypothetical protein
VQSPEENDIVVTRKSKRQRVEKSFDDDYIVYLVDNTPTTSEEAFCSPHADLWKEAARSRHEHFSGLAGFGSGRKNSCYFGLKNPTHDHPTGRVGPQFPGRARTWAGRSRIL